MNERISESVAAYMRWRGSQDYSKNTLDTTRYVLSNFARITKDVQTKRLSTAHIERYFDEASKTRSGRTLAGDHQIVGAFLKWCRHTKRMAGDNDPMYGRRSPAGIVKERRRVPASDFPRLLDAAGDRSPRDRGLTAFLLYTLCRDGEARSVKIRDLHLDQGYVKVTVHKSRSEDSLPISSELDTEMRRWLKAYTETVGPLDGNDLLFPARQPMPLFENGKIVGHGFSYRKGQAVRSARQVVQPALNDIGFATHDKDGKSLYEGAHTLRRSGARALFDALSADGGYDHPLRIVQAMLHHKSVTMTEKYIGVTADRRTRDELIRGKVMFPRRDENVLVLAR